MGLRQHSLPRVQFATETLPKDFFEGTEKGGPYLPVKSVFAGIFIWQCGCLMVLAHFR